MLCHVQYLDDDVHVHVRVNRHCFATPLITEVSI
jgi:hypothetical protein